MNSSKKKDAKDVNNSGKLLWRRMTNGNASVTGGGGGTLRLRNGGSSNSSSSNSSNNNFIVMSDGGGGDEEWDREAMRKVRETVLTLNYSTQKIAKATFFLLCSAARIFSPEGTRL